MSIVYLISDAYSSEETLFPETLFPTVKHVERAGSD
jgi:hypothetical protein